MSVEDLPIMNLPEKSWEYKIVQFDSDEHPYLRFGIKPGRYRDYHELIIERFALEIGVECTQIPGSSGLVVTLPSNSTYRLSGAGMYDINLSERTSL